MWRFCLGILCVYAQIDLGWVTLEDDGGPDDEVAQADLNMMGFNKDSPEYAELTWTWDDTTYPGGNSGDGCSLWDMNKNGKADFALCVAFKTVGARVEQTMTQLFDCKDQKPETCSYASQPGWTDAQNTSRMRATQDGSGPQLKSYCTVDFVEDPFAGRHLPAQQDPVNDTRAICRLFYEDLKQGNYPNGVIQPGDPSLINVCTYPSSSPTSNQKDCVVTVGNGFMVINKWSNAASQCVNYTARGRNCPPYTIDEVICTLFNCSQQATPVLWNFTLTQGQNTKTLSVSNFGWTQLASLGPGTWSVRESLPDGWVQIGFRCADGTTSQTVTILGGQTLVCYYVNFQGTVEEFNATYGVTPDNPFGNITFDTYEPNRTFAPTPAMAPTSACPVAVDPVFGNCSDADFTAASCSADCLAATNDFTVASVGVTSDVLEICFTDYNNVNYFQFSAAVMSLLADRINTATALCPGGNAPAPTEAPTDPLLSNHAVCASLAGATLFFAVCML